MNRPNFGNVYDYQTGAYLREARRDELRKTLGRLPESDCGAFEDPGSGRYVYVADEDSDIREQIEAYLTANKENDQ